jgi:hypothetical protein
MIAEGCGEASIFHLLAVFPPFIILYSGAHPYIFFRDSHGCGSRANFCYQVRHQFGWLQATQPFATAPVTA